jgi:hypothetical protein
MNLEQLTDAINRKTANGYEGDRIYSDVAADFFVTENQRDLYLLRPNGDVIRLNANHHIALSNIVQVTDWMSITKMGKFIVVSALHSKAQENIFVLLNIELNYIDRTNISCKTSSRPL